MRNVLSCYKACENYFSKISGKFKGKWGTSTSLRSRFQAAPLLSAVASASPEPPSALTFMSIVVGLPLALWTYKSLMMVLFQRRIIYMGYAPLGARTEKLSDPMHARNLDGLRCEEVTVPNRDAGGRLSGLWVTSSGQGMAPKVVVIYFQGNAGNPLHRLPVFQNLFRCTRRIPVPSSPSLQKNHSGVAVLAVAPRSYWTSTSRWPTEEGILSDYRAAINHATQRFPKAQVVLYGHSLGGAVAVCLLAEHDKQVQVAGSQEMLKDPSRIRGLILENPFSSIAGMVRALYPQRWVPYQYLTPFLFDRWDALGALQAASAPDMLQNPALESSLLKRLTGSMLVMVSEYDEVVPPNMGESLVNAAAKLCSMGDVPGGDSCTGARRKTVPCLAIIPGALHENAWGKWTWEKEMKSYFARFL